jgi:anti-anti-sigma factor
VLPQLYPSWLEAHQAGDVVVVRFLVSELLDEVPNRLLGEYLYDLVEKFGHRKFVLDLGAVRRVSSSLLGKLLVFQDRATKAGGRVALCGVNPEIGTVLQALQLTQVFPLYPGEAEALQAC